MHEIADRLAEKIHTLSAEQLAEVEAFVESLESWERDRRLTRASASLSEPAFASAWDNPDDDVYDAL